MPKPIALCCGDIHLCEKSPAMWDKDAWWPCQENMLVQINNIATEYGVGVVCSGDVFDKPRMSPKVEMLAMKHLRHWWMIPGQHDLPNHNIDLMPESSYGVLAEVVAPFLPLPYIYEFPWGAEHIPQAEKDVANTSAICNLHVALVHAMVWQGKEPYPGAPSTGNVLNLVKMLHGYDVIVCGDNHGGFVTTVGNTVVINCGSTMRRTVAQLDYQPQVHLLYDDKTVESINLDTSKDVVSDKHKQKRVDREDRIAAFVDTLSLGGEINLSYQENMMRALVDVEEEVKAVIVEEMV